MNYFSNINIFVLPFHKVFKGKYTKKNWSDQIVTPTFNTI